MTHDEIIEAMNQLSTLLGNIHNNIQAQANREAISAMANYPHGTSDPQLTKVKDQLVQIGFKVSQDIADLHKALMDLNGQ